MPLFANRRKRHLRVFGTAQFHTQESLILDRCMPCVLNELAAWMLLDPPCRADVPAQPPGKSRLQSGHIRALARLLSPAALLLPSAYSASAPTFNVSPSALHFAAVVAGSTPSKQVIVV